MIRLKLFMTRAGWAVLNAAGVFLRAVIVGAGGAAGVLITFYLLTSRWLPDLSATLLYLFGFDS